MDPKSNIQSQYHASLEMLKKVVGKFPVEHWNHPADKNRAWHIAYHTLFYTHFYLHRSEEDFQPWAKHRAEAISLKPAEGGQEPLPYTKDEVLEFLEYLVHQIDRMVAAFDMEAESGFDWLPFNKLELQFYNIRHLMMHTGELAERLWAVAGDEVGWVGRRIPTE